MAVGRDTPSSSIASLVVTRPVRRRCSTNRSEPGGSPARIRAAIGSSRNVTRTEAPVCTKTGSGSPAAPSPGTSGRRLAELLPEAQVGHGARETTTGFHACAFREVNGSR